MGGAHGRVCVGSVGNVGGGAWVRAGSSSSRRGRDVRRYLVDQPSDAPCTHATPSAPPLTSTHPPAPPALPQPDPAVRRGVWQAVRQPGGPRLCGELWGGGGAQSARVHAQVRDAAACVAVPRVYAHACHVGGWLAVWGRAPRACSLLRLPTPTTTATTATSNPSPRRAPQRAAALPGPNAARRGGGGQLAGGQPGAGGGRRPAHRHGGPCWDPGGGVGLVGWGGVGWGG